MQISKPVGNGCANVPIDVGTIQILLNRYIKAGKLPGLKTLSEDQDWGPNSSAALGMFELVFMGIAYGRVDPGSPTLSKLNEMSYPGIEKLLEKFNKEAELTKQEKIELVQAELKKLKAEGKLSEAQYHWASAAAKNVLNAAGDLVTYTNLALDLLDLVGKLSTAAQHTAAFGIVSIAGPILQFIGFIYLLSEAMDTGIRIYRCVGVSYAVTAWAFNEPCPSDCSMVRDRLTGPAYYGKSHSGLELDRNWIAAVGQTKRKLEELKRKTGPDGEQLLKYAMRGEGKVDLTRTTMRSIAAEIPKKREMEAVALRNIARDVRYPK